MIARPYGLNLHDWADSLALDLVGVGRLVDDDWKTWATRQLIDNPNVDDNIPNPYEFDNWQDWAERVCLILA